MITNNDNDILQVTQLELRKSQCYNMIRNCAQKIYDCVNSDYYQDMWDSYYLINLHIRINFGKETVLDYYTQTYITCKYTVEDIYSKLVVEIRDVCKTPSINNIFTTDVFYQHNHNSVRIIDITSLETYRKYMLKDITFSIT